MILVQGRAGSGSLAQLLPDSESAHRFMATFDQVSRHSIEWTCDEVQATELRVAISEVEKVRNRTRQQ